MNALRRFLQRGLSTRAVEHLKEVATPRKPRALSEEAAEVKNKLRANDFGIPRRSRASASFAANGQSAPSGGQASHAQFGHTHAESNSVLGSTTQ